MLRSEVSSAAPWKAGLPGEERASSLQACGQRFSQWELRALEGRAVVTTSWAEGQGTGPPGCWQGSRDEYAASVCWGSSGSCCGPGHSRVRGGRGMQRGAAGGWAGGL